MLGWTELAEVNKRGLRSTHSHCMFEQITLRDLRTFKMEQEFDAFSGSLSDFDVHGNLLAACGFSSRGLNGLSCDRFLMVYDLRMMRAVTPLQVHVDPLFLRFIPTYTSRLAIISQTGTFGKRSVPLRGPCSQDPLRLPCLQVSASSASPLVWLTWRISFTSTPWASCS